MRRTLFLAATLLLLAAQGCKGPEDCADGDDNDRDGTTDCNDSDCDASPSCVEVDCADGVDSDGDGAVDCDDPDCGEDAACVEVCGDGVDNDGDGRVDCRDSECVALPECDEDCGDGVDNDNDGDADCLDNECDLDAACAEDCQDGVDNDDDGDLDCLDAFCDDAPECDEDCADGLDNDQDGDADCADLDCVFDPPCAAPGSVVTLDFGVVPTNQPHEFVIPPGAQGFTITIEGAPTATYQLAELRNPLGNRIINNGEGSGIRQFTNPQAFGLVVPSNELSSNDPVPGVWRLIFTSSQGPDTARLQIHVRLEPFTTGLMDLKFYIPSGLRACLDAGCNGGAGDLMSSGTAAGFAEIQGMLNSFFAEFYADEGGFSQGNVSFFNISSTFLTITDNDEFEQMLTESALGGEGGLHVFLVQSIVIGGSVIGISSGIPGAIGTAGNKNSGIMAQILFDPALNTNLSGQLIAHELGHFLGLFHTTEFSGDADLIGDTPVCQPQVIQNDPASCPDVPFMMFPILFPGATELSPNEVIPLRAGRVYR
jgi:hypothetical protein